MPYNSIDILECRRSQKGPQKKKRDSGERGKYFPWRNSIEGLIALCLLYHWATANYATDDEFAAAPMGDYMVYAEGMEKFLRLFYPPLFPAYYKVTGKELTAKVIYDRFHKMFWQKDSLEGKKAGGTANFKTSNEHPKRDAILKNILPVVMHRFKLGACCPDWWVGWDASVVLDSLPKKHK